MTYRLASVWVDEIGPVTEVTKRFAHIDCGADEGFSELFTFSSHIFVPVEDVVLGAVRQSYGVHVHGRKAQVGEERAELGLESLGAVVELAGQEFRIDGRNKWSNARDGCLENIREKINCTDV